ncbi:MAG: hypothetical protein SO000_07275 [Sodaliphilus sp.]|nr:hypothetical protein [Sodaliphilus sp.]
MRTKLLASQARRIAALAAIVALACGTAAAGGRNHHKHHHGPHHPPMERPLPPPPPPAPPHHHNYGGNSTVFSLTLGSGASNRLNLAISFMRRHGREMSVDDYCRLTGLRRKAARAELNRFCKHHRLAHGRGGHYRLRHH